ncbi:MAG TPA: cytochrome c [Thermoanaerobaculia bacterium]|jgi:cytochrome c2|nr:cytochrome c [Thermoanaerobaculia bacterium]
MKKLASLAASGPLALLALIALIPVVTAVALGPLVEPAAAAELDGKQIFLAQKCNLCHSVSSAGIAATVKSEKVKGPDLAGLVVKQDARLLTDFLHKKAEIDGKKHGKEFTGSDQELAAVIAWLQKQEKK